MEHTDKSEVRKCSDEALENSPNTRIKKHQPKDVASLVVTQPVATQLENTK